MPDSSISTSISAYSLLKGSIKIQKLGELAKADRQPALALTDTDNMFGALEFSDKMAGYGIQPIIGCELAVDFGDQDPAARNALAAGPARIVLLAARERGYRSLMRLNSRAFLETPIHQAPHIKLEWLEDDAEDLIALTGGPEGPISLAIHRRACGAGGASAATGWRSLFGDRLYIELQRHGVEQGAPRRSRPDRSRLRQGPAAGGDQRAAFRHARTITKRMTRCCASPAARLVAETDREQLTPDHRFKTRAEMAVLFADLPEALASTVEIARALRLPPDDAQADPAALHGRRRPDRGLRQRRSRRIAPAGRGGAGQPAPGPRPGAGRDRGDLSRAPRLRARRHHPDGISGLLPDRRRLHQMGEERRAFRSDRAAARARARWSPMR